MAYNPYSEEQPVKIVDPSGRLSAAGLVNDTFHFPYTPTISSITNTNYNVAATTHSNFQQAFFESAGNAQFSLTAPIIIENVEQGNYIVKALDFFRGSMKMRFGLNDPERGLPPPVLRFFAHGIYENVPVLLTDFTYNLDADMSYIDLDGGKRLPVSSTFVMSLITTYSPKNVRETFSVDDYLSGNLRGNGYV